MSYLQLPVEQGNETSVFCTECRCTAAPVETVALVKTATLVTHGSLTPGNLLVCGQ
ncbi:hypothetical protein P7K49_028056 [Saguinus oedipus]|uniref:Uncharacterized protein n=1 Tax=Saguinus oedipus TaxID=9490 RepID=A0ABQ9UB52_SAGOE|nr:hypothetical protein P7K49_028056 [Saguinus oedipus]